MVALQFVLWISRVGDCSCGYALTMANCKLSCSQTDYILVAGRVRDMDRVIEIVTVVCT